MRCVLIPSSSARCLCAASGLGTAQHAGVYARISQTTELAIRSATSARFFPGRPDHQCKHKAAPAKKGGRLCVAFRRTMEDSTSPSIG